MITLTIVKDGKTIKADIPTEHLEQGSGTDGSILINIHGFIFIVADSADPRILQLAKYTRDAEHLYTVLKDNPIIHSVIQASLVYYLLVKLSGDKTAVEEVDLFTVIETFIGQRARETLLGGAIGIITVTDSPIPGSDTIQ